MIRECPICKINYDADEKRLKHGRQTTCTRRCSYKFRAQKIRKPIAIKECACGNLFQSKNKFCNPKCIQKIKITSSKTTLKQIRPKNKSKPEYKYTCYFCEKSISTTVKKSKKRHFCDRRCFEKQKSIDMSGIKNHMYGKTPTCKACDWKQGWYKVGNQEYFFRSSWEIAVAFYLENNGFQWKYELKRFDLNGLTYKPDFFLLNDGKILKIIEVKGWIRPKDINKISRFRNLFDIPIEVWDRPKLKSLNLLDSNFYGKIDVKNT